MEETKPTHIAVESFVGQVWHGVMNFPKWESAKRDVIIPCASPIINIIDTVVYLNIIAVYIALFFMALLAD